MSRTKNAAESKQKLRVGFDLGGTKMFATVYDSSGLLLAEERTESRGYDGMEHGLARMVRLTKKAIRSAGASEQNVHAVGIACPAVIDLKEGMMVYAPNLGWKNVPVADVFRREFPGSKISVLNDVDAGTYGEYAHGSGRGARTVLGIFAGTGLGSGCVYDGKLVRGKRFSCMEIGNLRLPGPSLFGSVHSPPRVEEIVSRLGLAGAAAVAAYRGDAPTILSHAKSDLRKIKADTLASALDAGDPAIVQAVENSVFYLAVAVAAAVDLLGPDRIVLGGGLVERMPQHFCNGLQHHLKQLACPGIVDDIQVIVASLGDYAVPIGAAAHAAAMQN